MIDIADRHGLALHNATMPPWLGDEAFHMAHRSNLRRKDPTHYSPERLGPVWDVPDDLLYQWPVLDGRGGYTLRVI
jgi:hypothetical protein